MADADGTDDEADDNSFGFFEGGSQFIKNLLLRHVQNIWLFHSCLQQLGGWWGANVCFKNTNEQPSDEEKFNEIYGEK